MSQEVYHVLHTADGAPQQLYDIRLPDGSQVQWTAQQLAVYDGDWHVRLSIEQSELLYKDIMEDVNILKVYSI